MPIQVRRRRWEGGKKVDPHHPIELASPPQLAFTSLSLPPSSLVAVAIIVTTTPGSLSKVSALKTCLFRGPQACLRRLVSLVLVGYRVSAVSNVLETQRTLLLSYTR